jgi:hypothetical protein
MKDVKFRRGRSLMQPHVLSLADRVAEPQTMKCTDFGSGTRRTDFPTVGDQPRAFSFGASLR